MMKQTKNCPYCGEEILADAKKCKHCGEWVDSQPKAKKKDDDEWGEDSTKGCLLIIAIIVALIWAYNAKPSEEKIHQAILEEVKEQIADKTSSTINLLSGNRDNTLGGLASLFINESGEEISKSFYQYNDIRINEHWFYRTGEIVNSSHPSGTTVAFGIWGIVIPFVGWDDFKMSR